MRGRSGLARLLTALALAALALAGAAVRWSLWQAAAPLRAVSLVLAVCAALLGAAALARPGPAASAAREARMQFAARIAAALAALLPLAWAVLTPGRQAGSAVAAGTAALGLFGMVLLSAYLCLHLRASLLTARFWATAAVCALASTAFLRSSGYDVGAVHALALAVDLAAAGALVSLSGSLPGRRPTAEIPLAELAALSLFGSSWAFGSPGPVALFAAGCALVAAVLRRFARLAPLAQAVCAAAAAAVLLDGDTGAVAIPLLACALAIGR